MIRTCLIAAIIGLWLSCALAQSPPAASSNDKGAVLKDRVMKFYRLYPREKAFLLTDNTVYIPGETIWYKLYLWNEDALETKVSNVAHVVVRNEAGDVIIKQHVLVARNESHGDIALPDSLASGIYSLEVFTNWMLNFSSLPITSKPLWISNGEQSLTFFKSDNFQPLIRPEGGHITCDGEVNRIAVSSGAASGFSFELIDPQGGSVYREQFSGSYAIVNVRLSSPGAYRAKVCPVNAAKCYEEKLFTPDDIAIRLQEDVSRKKITVHFNKNPPPRERWLLALTESSVIDVIYLRPEHYLQSFDLHTENYPEGTVHLMVVNDQYRIESHRAFYHVKDQPVRKIIQEAQIEKILVDDRREVRLTKPAADDLFAAIVVPDNVRCGSFFLRHVVLTDHTLNEMMLFESFYLGDVLTKFLNASYLPIVHSTNTPLNKRLDYIPTYSDSRLNPLALILSGLNNGPKADSIVAFKNDLARINATYYDQGAAPGYEKIAADVVYIPKDYSSIKSLVEFLRQAIPPLKFNSPNDHNAMSFLISNLKGHKELYPGKPAVVLNGYVMPDLNAIKDLPVSEITSIEILYEPQTLIDANLKNIFPYGAIAIYTSDAASALTKNMTLHKRFFSGALSWPHVFQHKRLFAENADDRWPFFKSLYSWKPDLNFTRQKRLSIGEIPVLTPPKYTLLVFSLEQVKHETLTEVVLD